MLVENLQREDLAPLEEAEAYHRLLELGRSQHQLAERVGRSQSHISKRLALLELPAKARKAVDSGGIDLSDALELQAAGYQLAKPEKAMLERAKKAPR